MADDAPPTLYDQLVKAIDDKDNARVKEIIASGGITDYEQGDKSGWTPVRMAIRANNAEALALVLDAGAKAETSTQQRETPLTYAIEHYQANPKIVRLLLEHGANPSTALFIDKVPLHLAAAGGHETIVMSLLEFGADPGQTGEGRRTAMHKAAEKGQEGVIRILCENGGGLDVKDGQERTPLEEAMRHNRSGAFDTLMDLGANPRINGKSGATLLMWAGLLGSAAAVRRLAACGLDLNARKEDDGFTPLMWAAWSGRAEGMRALLQEGADPAIRSKEGKTARSIADERGHAHIVKMIDEHLASGIRKGLDGVLKVRRPLALKKGVTP